ncbi:MFS transporter [Symbioplanes lichenis]|uniref:MFS transporter n=1 Tax=Symbioplanes lichenis TaxID=1629072 RepID=UPI003F692FB9
MPVSTFLRQLVPPAGPARVLGTITLVNTTGSGLWITSSALYATVVLGLSATELGVALTCSALASLLSSTPFGYLADRRGPRLLQAVFYLLLASFSAAMIFAQGFVGFLVVSVLTALADAAQRGARQALIAGLVPRDERVRTRAIFRSLANVGITLGSALGGIGLAVGTPMVYRVLILGNALSYVVIALIALRLPHLAPIPHKPSEPRLTSLRDKPFLAFVVLDGLMSMHGGILQIVLPLWIVQFTRAPHWLIAACMVLNAVMVVLLQVRMSRGTEGTAGAVRAMRWSGLLVAGACAIFALTSRGPTPLVVALIIGGVVLHGLGELRQSAAGWGLSYGMAPPDAPGQYQATYAMGAQLGRMIAPMVLTALVLVWGPPGWLALGLLMLFPAVAIGPVVAWHHHRRARGAGDGSHDSSAGAEVSGNEVRQSLAHPPDVISPENAEVVGGSPDGLRSRLDPGQPAPHAGVVEFGRD